MKASEITKEDIEQWKKDGYFPVVCRLCDEVMLYPKANYDPKMFERGGYECGCHKRGIGGMI